MQAVLNARKEYHRTLYFWGLKAFCIKQKDSLIDEDALTF